MADSTSPSAGQAFVHWILLVVPFLAGGGLASGITALAYKGLVGTEYARELYALVFGVSGYITFRLTWQVLGYGQR